MLGAQLFEVIAPAARPAELHERQIVERRKRYRRLGGKLIACRTDQIGRCLGEIDIAIPGRRAHPIEYCEIDAPVFQPGFELGALTFAHGELDQRIPLL